MCLACLAPTAPYLPSTKRLKQYDCRYKIALQYVQRIHWPDGAEVQQVVDDEALACLAKGPSGAPDHAAELPALLQRAAGAEGQLMAVAVWLRFAAARLLLWNHNYNVKPREISTAQEHLTSAVADVWATWYARAAGPATLLYRRTAKYCSSWTELLGVGGVFVGCLGTATMVRVLQ